MRVSAVTKRKSLEMKNIIAKGLSPHIGIDLTINIDDRLLQGVVIIVLLLLMESDILPIGFSSVSLFERLFHNLTLMIVFEDRRIIFLYCKILCLR